MTSRPLAALYTLYPYPHPWPEKGKVKTDRPGPPLFQKTVEGILGRPQPAKLPEKGEVQFG